MKRTVHLRSRSRGAAVVELALLLVPLLTLTFGMTELGRALHDYHILLKCTRDAARYLSLAPTDPARETAARCLAVYGQSPCASLGATDALVPGLSPDKIHIRLDGAGTVPVLTVSIEDVAFHSVMPMVVDDFVFGPIATTMRQASP